MSYGADVLGVESYGSTPAYTTGQVEPEVIVLFEPTPGNWVDISYDFMYGNTMRGKQRELDRYQAGTASITLLNESRDYDPKNTASPYNGAIKPRKRIQVKSLFNGVFDSHFLGYINRWVQDYSQHNTARTTIEATDGFLIFANAHLPSSVYALEVLNDEPVAFWRLDEPDTATVAYDSIGGKNLSVFTADFGQTSLVSRESGSSVLLTDETESLSTHGTPILSGPPITLEVVYKRTTAGSDGSLIGQFASGGTGAVSPGAFWITAASTGILLATGINGAGSSASAFTTGVDMDDLLTHHIVATWGSDGRIRIYVDGVDRTNGSTTLAATAFNSTSAFYFVGGTPVGVSDLADGGTYQMGAFYDYELTPAQIAIHADAVSTPWNNDLTGERITRLLDELDWDTTLRDIDTGETTLQSATLATSFLDHLQKVAETEFGAFFIDKDGNVVFKSRHDLVNVASSATFGDDPNDATELPYRSIQPEFSEELIRNDVTVSRSEGTAQNVKDQTSIDEYQKKSFTLDGLLHDNDDHSQDMAEFILSEYSQPVQRISALVLGTPQVGKESLLYPQMLGRELTDRITTIDRPPGGGDPNEGIYVIEGISHSFGPKYWETSFNLSPAFAGAFWQIGVPGFSEIGETTRVFF